MVLVARDPDPLDVLEDPFRLEGAGHHPDVLLFWVSAALVEGPGIGDVLHEEGVLERLSPDPGVGELWPAWIVDGNGLDLGEERLLAGDHLLEEGEGAVFLRGRELALDMTEGEKAAWHLPYRL